MAPRPRLVALHPVHGYAIAPPQDLKTMKRNARERNRVLTVNQSFETLRRAVPSAAAHRKLSKVNIVQQAMEYIHSLVQLLQEADMTSQDSPRGSNASSPSCLSSSVPCWSFQSSYPHGPEGIRLVSSSFSGQNCMQHHVIQCFNSLPDGDGLKLDKSSKNSCQQYNDVCCRLQDDSCVLLDVRCRPRDDDHCISPDVQCHPRDESCYSPDILGCSSDDSCSVPAISCRPPDDSRCPVPAISCRPPDDSCLQPSVRSSGAPEKEDDVLNVIMDWQMS